MCIKKLLPFLFLLITFFLNVSKTYSKDFAIHDSIDSPRKLVAEKKAENPLNADLSKKYAQLLRTNEKEINKFINLYRFIDSWMGTRYLWGGCNRSGIDCSCFVMTLYSDVFDIKIKRTSFTQFYDNNIDLFTNRSQFQLGDLVFFKTQVNRETRNNKVTHVGFYLTNGYFIQSSSAGVNIANLNQGYWKNCFVAAGRLRPKFYKQSSKLAMPTGDIDSSNTIQAEDLQNSDFDPVPYPEDLDDLKEMYAKVLEIDPERIAFPEMFEQIDSFKYAPFNFQRNCKEKINNQHCFIQNFYSNVLGITIDANSDVVRSQSYTAQLKPKERASDSLAAFDIVLLKTDKRQKQYDITGVYLYNNYFLHLLGNDVTISNLKDSLYQNSIAHYYRIDDTLLKKGYEFIKQKRRATGRNIPDEELTATVHDTLIDNRPELKTQPEKKKNKKERSSKSKSKKEGRENIPVIKPKDANTEKLGEQGFLKIKKH